MANCLKTSTGQIPLTDSIGLYETGNDIPPAYRLIGENALKEIVPVSGKYTLGIFGFSNTKRIFQTAIRNWRFMKSKRQLRPFLLAQGGYDTARMSVFDLNDTKNYWAFILARLQNLKVPVDPAEFQIGLWQIALGKYKGTAENYKIDLYEAAVCSLQHMHAVFPNIKMVGMFDREYSGYATTQTNPEPFARATGDVVREMIRAKHHGTDARLSELPWLWWGGSFWADGLKARQWDGLTWDCAHFATDGTHPNLLGRANAFPVIDASLASEPLASPWYMGI